MRSRIKRHFVSTDPANGQTIVSNTPCKNNLIPDYLYRAERPGERASAQAAAAASAGSPNSPGGANNGVEQSFSQAPMPLDESSSLYGGGGDGESSTADGAGGRRRKRGGGGRGMASRFQFSAVKMTNDFSEEERLKLKLAWQMECGVCRKSYDYDNLPYQITKKAILEQRALWGSTQLNGANLIPSTMYAKVKICAFCGQFFGMERELSSRQTIDEAALSQEFDDCPYLRANVRDRVRAYRKQYREQVAVEEKKEREEEEIRLLTPNSFHSLPSPGGNSTSILNNPPPESNISPGGGAVALEISASMDMTMSLSHKPPTSDTTTSPSAQSSSVKHGASSSGNTTKSKPPRPTSAAAHRPNSKSSPATTPERRPQPSLGNDDLYDDEDLLLLHSEEAANAAGKQKKVSRVQLRMQEAELERQKKRKADQNFYSRRGARGEKESTNNVFQRMSLEDLEKQESAAVEAIYRNKIEEKARQRAQKSRMAMMPPSESFSHSPHTNSSTKKSKKKTITGTQHYSSLEDGEEDISWQTPPPARDVQTMNKFLDDLTSHMRKKQQLILTRKEEREKNKPGIDLSGLQKLKALSKSGQSAFIRGSTSSSFANSRQTGRRSNSGLA